MFDVENAVLIERVQLDVCFRMLMVGLIYCQYENVDL